jgi:hypothetical protein
VILFCSDSLVRHYLKILGLDFVVSFVLRIRQVDCCVLIAGEEKDEFLSSTLTESRDERWYSPRSIAADVTQNRKIYRGAD